MEGNIMLWSDLKIKRTGKETLLLATFNYRKCAQNERNRRS